MEHCQNFAANLNAIRRLRNLSLSEFSRELGIPKSTLQSILADGNTSLHTALYIADSLNVPLSSLTGEMIPNRSLDSILSLLNCLEWFNNLSDKIPMWPPTTTPRPPLWSGISASLWPAFGVKRRTCL